MAVKFQFDKRGLVLRVGSTILHFVCILGFGIFAFAPNWTLLESPAPPSVVGHCLSFVAGLLGFRLLTVSEFFLLRLPSGSWKSAILRSPAIFMANSVIWGFGAAWLWRRRRENTHA